MTNIFSLLQQRKQLSSAAVAHSDVISASTTRSTRAYQSATRAMDNLRAMPSSSQPRAPIINSPSSPIPTVEIELGLTSWSVERVMLLSS